MDRNETARIDLCGRLRVELDGRRLEDQLPGRQGRMLFAYLVLNRQRPVRRDELIEALWELERRPDDEERALSTLLSRLRRALGPGQLEGRGEITLTLPADAEVDVEVAARALGAAQEALGRADWRAARVAALAALSPAEQGLLPGYDASWADERRRALDDLRLDALDCLAQAALGRGAEDLGLVERAARELIERAPYRETGYLYLMQAHAARGNVAEALQVHDLLRCFLRDELGTVPSAAVRALHEQLLLGDAGRRLGGADAAAAGGDDGATGRLPRPALLATRDRDPFVGRAAELDRLHGELEAAGGGEPRIVFVAGEDGIGKTRLAARFAARAHAEGATVLYGRSDQETLIAYGPFIEALRHYVLAAPVAELEAVMEGRGAELGRLLPELRQRLPELPDPATDDPETERYRLFESVASLLGALANGAPVVLVLDDLHWADRPTLALLRHVLRAAGAAPVLVLATYRSTEVRRSDPLSHLVADLRRDGLLHELSLDGLGENDVHALAREAAGADPSVDVVRGLRRETRGNPFFLVELLRQRGPAGAAEDAAACGPSGDEPLGALPEGIKALAHRRVGRLGPEAEETLVLAAVAGAEFDFAVLARAAELPPGRLASILEEATESGILVESTEVVGRYAFAHTLIRAALYQELSQMRRARLHGLVGEAIEELRSPPADADLGALAHHFLAAAPIGDGAKAIEYATRAGERAAAQSAPEEALRCYGRALELVPGADAPTRHRLLLALAESHRSAGDEAAAAEVLQAARALAPAAAAEEDRRREDEDDAPPERRLRPVG